jgi:hypothetical protein
MFYNERDANVARAGNDLCTIGKELKQGRQHRCGEAIKLHANRDGAETDSNASLSDQL